MSLVPDMERTLKPSYKIVNIASEVGAAEQSFPL
jgi:hypothetical protein